MVIKNIRSKEGNKIGFLSEFISNYGSELLLAFISFIGLTFKTSYEKYVKEKTKKMIVEDSVRFVEQKFKNLSSKKKFEKAKGYALELLTDKGITISDLELEILIESVCNNLNNKTSYKSSETAINEDVKEA